MSKESNFIDYVKMYCRSGKGGNGIVHFHREKHMPKGGPDGGDGGRGGRLVVKANKQLWTLLHLKYRKHVTADNGENGGSALKTGASGKDVLIEVPPGTVARNADNNEVMIEVLEDGEEKILLEGGQGGKGNTFFKSATRQTPKFAQQGQPGKETEIIFELKILADVGLVGFPNAGKSTLLSVITAAKPQVADYPFTTLVPNLGIVAYRNNRSFVMADIPGIIKGASSGKGLGLRFLRHIERNPVLLFLVSADSQDITKEYQVLLDELGNYSKEMLDKKKLLAVSKADMLDEELENEIKKSLPDVPYVFISSLNQQGLTELKDMLWKELTTEDY